MHSLTVEPLHVRIKKRWKLLLVPVFYNVSIYKSPCMPVIKAHNGARKKIPLIMVVTMHVNGQNGGSLRQ